MEREDKENSTNEIEVSAEMIEAGMWEYSRRWRGLRDADDGIAREMLSAAYRAMYASRSKFSDESPEIFRCGHKCALPTR